MKTKCIGSGQLSVKQFNIAETPLVYSRCPGCNRVVRGLEGSGIPTHYPDSYRLQWLTPVKK